MDINTRRAQQDFSYPAARFSEKGCLQVCGGGDALNKVYRELLLAFSSFAKLFGFPFFNGPHIYYLLCIFFLTWLFTGLLE
jgi:hypothetical protein